MNELAELIRREIRKNGVISFHRFMEMALYEPGLGYYETHRDIGRHGDYYTSVSVGKLFGELLGFQFAQWLAPLEGEVQLLEAGVHDGQLAKDILNYLRNWQPEIYERTTLVLLEPSQIHRQWQTETLVNHAAKVKWRGEESEPFRGVFYCNELLDAFPAHKLEWDAAAQSWFECGVGESDGQFEWRRMDEVKDNWNAGPELPDGSGMIHVPDHAPFWNGVCNNLREGRAVAFDYFLEEEEFFTPTRPHGTLRAYHAHQHSDDLLANVGEQDITASVNLAELKFAVKASGVNGSAVSSQANFLVHIFEQTLEHPGQFPEWSPERTRQFQTLVHPEHLGRAFKVLEYWRS